jgi:hypothetical protein
LAFAANIMAAVGKTAKVIGTADIHHCSLIAGSFGNLGFVVVAAGINFVVVAAGIGFAVDSTADFTDCIDFFMVLEVLKVKKV